MPSVYKTGDSTVKVNYPVSEAELDITLAEYQLIANAILPKIDCIKFIRAQYKTGLLEAKRVVEVIRDMRRIDENRTEY